MKKILLYVFASMALFVYLKIDSSSVQLMQAMNEVANQKSGESSADKFPGMDSPEVFANMMNDIRTQNGDDGPKYRPGYVMEELKKARNLARTSRADARQMMDDLTFVERGPGNVPGRTRGLLVDPSDASGNTWFAGSVGGGIWKTTDSGASWTDMTPDFPNLATSTLAMSASDNNIMYAGTGENGFFNLDAITGTGIFKSIDGGDTWSQLPSTSDLLEFGSVNRLIVDPSDANIVLAALFHNDANSGLESTIRKSIDGGMTWTTVYETDGQANVQDLIYSPGDFSIQYGAVHGSGVIKSTDSGETWTLHTEGFLLGGPPSGGRLELDISRVNTNRLFASAQGSAIGTGSDLYLSDDAGLTWIPLAEENGNNVGFLGTQGWYDNTVLAHPFDEDIVYVGGINKFKYVVGDGTIQANSTVTSVDENGTEPFLGFVGFGGAFFNGAIDQSADAANRNYVSVELRFGTGRSQMAHRFLVPEGQGSGVPDASYSYADYVEVPFEAWDIDNNRQLMVSFRDQQRDGGFDLIEQNTDGDPTTHAREYIYISQDTYDASGPNPNFTTDGGHVVSDLYFMWSVLAPGASSDPATWPTSELTINFEATIGRNAQISNYTGGGINNNVHVDNHEMITIIDSEEDKTFRVLNANDGGVWVTNSSADPGANDGEWTFTGNEYNTSQPYGADKAPGADRYITGLQDNGTWYSPAGEDASASTSYIFSIGGDGFQSIWHSSDILKMVGGSQNNGIQRTVDGGMNWTAAAPNDAGNGNAPFITKIANSKKNPEVLYTVGITGVWRSADFAGTWVSVPITSQWRVSSNMQVKVSIADFNVVWAGSDISSSGRMHVSTDDGASFTPTNNYDIEEMGRISGFATHPTEQNTAYALFSFARGPKILKTTDLGQTWADISGFGSGDESTTGFPDVAVYDLLVMPHDPDRIWAGTEIGIVESLDGGATWALYDSNFPSVSVWQMLVQDDQVVIATHGRGIWSVTIEDLPSVISSPSLREVAESPTEELNLRANFVNEFDQVEILVDGTVMTTVNNVAVGEQFFNVTGLTSFGDKAIQIRATAGSEVRMSNTITFNFSDILDPIDTYENVFRTQDEDFFASSSLFNRFFTVSGFDGGGIHTNHPYTNSISATYQLVAPMTVASENANFTYDDVAIMELGDEGSVFGESAFNDYVIVEGTTDGITWIPLETGYDASYNASWTSIINQGLTPSSDDMITHNIDLLDKFSAGDVVFLRFRVFTDGGGTNWGWAVDNLEIQTGGGTTTGFEDDILNEKQAIRTYPNPVSSRTKIEFFIPHRSNAVIEMVDMNGRLIFEDNLGTRNQGLNSVDWERGNIEQGIYILKLHTIDGVTTTRVQLN